MSDKPLGYLAGGIMSFAERLARQYEYDRFIEEGLNTDVYSPILNKDINDKTSVTEEENNALAEKITAADIDRLWRSDWVVISPEQHAVGTLCELGCLYGWKYMTAKFYEAIIDELELCKKYRDNGQTELAAGVAINAFATMVKMLEDMGRKHVFAHYDDIRTNHLNEKDWRRSFGINQLLYGMILACTEDHQLHNTFEDVLPKLKEALKQEADHAE